LTDYALILDRRTLGVTGYAASGGVTGYASSMRCRLLTDNKLVSVACNVLLNPRMVDLLAEEVERAVRCAK
jgi:hypothetical protein